ncbi:MAG: hypothetical protein Q9P01_00870 [Anaerolineae bacterium]|nr:hypothetical protein [Anaerolineae bacterium]
MGINGIACDDPPQFNVIVVDGASGAASQSVQSVGTFETESLPFTSDGTCTIREAILSANNEGIIPEQLDDLNPTDCLATIYDPELDANLIAVELFPDNTYAISERLPIITGQVLIRRNPSLSGTAIIERSNGTASFGIFEIASTGILKLDNVIISNGYVVGNGGGILNAGALTLIDSAVIGNYATGNGGGIYNTGTGSLTIQNSVIQDNIALGQGGAIYHDSSVTANVSSGCIVNNWGLQDNSSIFTPATASTITATGNWWGMGSGAFGVGTGQGDSVRGNIIATMPLTSAPTFNGDVCGTSIIILEGTWTVEQQAAILTGVVNIGNALATQTSIAGDSATEAFRQVMLDMSGGLTQIKFIRSGSAATCTTEDSISRLPPPLVARITCGTANNFTEFTAVHELGHVFIDRTGNQFSTLVNQAIVFDGEGINRVIIFGSTTWTLPSNETVSDWYRGERGWGSDAKWFNVVNGTIDAEGPCDGTSSMVGVFVSNFQQNPCHVKNWIFTDPSHTIDDVELEEAAADMFLNWVYRTLGMGGFENIDWRFGQNPRDLTNPGDIYFDYINQIVPTIFINKGW